MKRKKKRRWKSPWSAEQAAAMHGLKGQAARLAVRSEHAMTNVRRVRLGMKAAEFVLTVVNRVL